MLFSAANIITNVLKAIDLPVVVNYFLRSPFSFDASSNAL
jgi:hypothetical protein